MVNRHAWLALAVGAACVLERWCGSPDSSGSGDSSGTTEAPPDGSAVRTSQSRDEPLPSFGAARLEYQIVTGPTFQFKFVAAEPAAGAISPVSISGSL